MESSYPGGHIIEVDFDSCIFEPQRVAGSPPGGALWPGEKLHCMTHGLTIVQHQPTYFQAAQKCALVDVANPAQRARRSTRTTDWLTAADVVKLYLAVLRANLQGMTLNYFATISWSTLGLEDDAEIQAATQALFVRLREWSKRKRDVRTGHPTPIRLAWIWCHERGPKMGMHTHLLMHVPRRCSSRTGKVICRFLEAYTGRPLLQEGPGGLATFKADEPRLKPASGKSRGRAKRYPALAFQRQIARYMMKGVDPDAVVPAAAARQRGQDLGEILKIEDMGTPTRILGKRCGYSVQNLGAASFARVADRLGLRSDEAEHLLAKSGFAFDNEALVVHDASYLRPR
jgi:hypothetical protein